MRDETAKRMVPTSHRAPSTDGEEARDAAELYEFGPFRLDPKERRLWRNSDPVVLTPKAFDTLVLLVRNSGHLLEKDELTRALWPDSFVEEGNLSNSIFVLRKALGENPQYIETMPKRGYRFLGAVRQLSSGPPLRPERATDGSLAIAAVPSKVKWVWRSRAALGIAAIVLLVSLVFAGWFYERASQSTGKIDSIAVLPFVNATADPNAEYLSDGFTESLINNLGQLPNLKVKSRNSVFRYKGKDTDAQTVGRQLGVDAVLEGRVAHHGDGLVVSVELTNTENDTHIWGRQYERKMTDIIALQEAIAVDVTTGLRLRLTGEDQKRLTRSYTTNTEAYQDYLRGRYLWNKRTEEGMNKGIAYFQQAIAKDSRYALAYDGLADSYILLPIYGFLPPNEALPKAKEAALKSLEIDVSLAEAHTSLARIKAEYDWDWPGAEKEFQRATDLNPGYATAYQWHGDVLQTMGRQDEAVAQYKRALELDPLSLVINTMLGQAFYHARQYDQAIAQLQNTVELDPNYGIAHEYIGLAYLQKSMGKESMRELERGLVISPNSPAALWKVGFAYGLSGRSSEARQILQRLDDLTKKQYVAPVMMASVYVGLGEKDKAFSLLEKGYEERFIGLGGVDLKLNPGWDPLRSDPRFADLLRRINLQP